MGSPSGFNFTTVGSEVRITHNGVHASTLRGDAATRFLTDVETDDPQELMARITGNYKRGNERAAKNHPRNTPR